MKRGIQWHSDAWDEYCKWKQTDKVTLKHINTLVKDICRDPFNGIGKPEPLKHNLSGLWSRCINDVDRLSYFLKDDILIIIFDWCTQVFQSFIKFLCLYSLYTK